MEERTQYVCANIPLHKRKGCFNSVLDTTEKLSTFPTKKKNFSFVRFHEDHSLQEENIRGMNFTSSEGYEVHIFYFL